MELQSFRSVSFQIVPSISKQLNGFIHFPKPSYCATTSLGTTSKSRASSTCHRGPCKQVSKRNRRPRCSRDDASLVSKEIRRDLKGEKADDSDEEDPSWSDEEDEGWGFPLSAFFNDIRLIKPKKDNDDEDDEDYLTEDEDDLQFGSVEVPVKAITAKEWEDVAFGDLSPLVVLVYERYDRPLENMKVREELVKAINVFWDSDKAAPRQAVKFDATEETKLASSLNVEETPVVIFIKNGMLVHRQKEVLVADDLAKIIAYFYYGANLPECLKSTKFAEEKVPSLT